MPDAQSLGSSQSISLPPRRSRGSLLKVLGVWFGIAAGLGNAIGAGIVRAPGDVAQWLPVPLLFLSVWLVGGLYALVSASSMAELGAAIPRSGGQYNFSRRALGDYAGFVVGWSDWLSTCGSGATIAMVAGEYTSALFPSLAASSKWIALAAILGLGILQWRGIRWGEAAQLLTAAVKAIALVIVVAACFILGSHAHAAASAAPAPPALASGWLLAVNFMLALQAVIYAIDGWDGIIYFGAEVRNPGRDVPRAIFGSVLSVMAIFLFVNAAVIFVIPIGQVAGNGFSLGTAAEKIFGPYGDPLIRSIMVVSLISCLNANQLFATRTIHAMSEDRLIFRSLASVNAGGTPDLSLLATTIVAVLFVLGSFERVIAMLSFFFVANYTLTYASLFVLRKKEPQMERPYRAWGYPWTTGIALGGSALFLIASIATDRKNAPWALAMLLLSYPIYLIFKRVSASSA